MTHNQRDAASSGILAWTAHASNLSGLVAEEEVAAEVDEPPERRLRPRPSENIFQRTIVRTQHDKHPSLLTKALQNHSDDDDSTTAPPALAETGRRRSMTSNVSFASTADLTSDTGLTSPSRTNTPSPPLPEMRMLRLSIAPVDRKALVTGSVLHRDDKDAVTPKQEQPPQVVVTPKRKCISFACTAKPNGAPATRPVQQAQPVQPAPEIKPLTQDAPRRSCLKFAPGVAPTRPTVETASNVSRPHATSDKPASPSAVRKARSSAPSRSPRPSTPHRTSNQSIAVTKNKYLTANSKDLTESSRFHEFARDELHEDDWIRQDTAATATRGKLTINDTLQKEYAIRKLGTEAEEEALQEQDEEEEEEEEEEEANDDDLDAEDDEEGQDAVNDDEHDFDDAEEDLSGYDSDDGSSGGYHTDEETGFAASDDEDEDEDGLHLWTPGRPALRLSGEATIPLRPIAREEQHSDSSIPSRTSVRARRGSRTRRIKIRPGTPELPDSTDFVCGTLDEDRPMEDAYISCIAARKREKAHLIPQDIDPSFPASDPEDEEDEDLFNPVHHDSDDDVWLHGEMEDIQTDHERMRRKKKTDNVSPKRYHSPPPKRRHSPPPATKARGRSPPPKRLFDRQSPRRSRYSPPATGLKSPPASLRNNAGAITFKPLGSRPGLTHTKSLPKPTALFPQLRKGRAKAANLDLHVRGAIDIVRGLQQKRQRRREKFYQVYCNRARKGQIPERRPQPGQGAERMRELGLLMAGKIDHGNYVLSV